MKEGLTIFVICYLVLIVSDSEGKFVNICHLLRYLVLIVSDSEGRFDNICQLLPGFDSFR